MILLNDFKRQWAEIRDEAVRVFEEVGESGWYILGRGVEEFERSLAPLFGHRFAVGVASGLDALEISLRALGCEPGDRVLTTPVSAFATTLAILKIGAIPVFTDIDGSGLMDLADCPETPFAIPVHLYGHPMDLTPLAGRIVIEDCAQSIGTPAGRFGQIAATSFYPTKNLGAMGDGGAILTSNESLAAKARALRDYGQTAKYQHSMIGYNSRIDELHAALLDRVFLPRLESWTARRRDVAARYRAEILNPAVAIPPAPEDSCWHLFPVLVEPESKPAFVQHMRQSGVLTGEHYPAAIPDQPAMAACGYEIAGSLERARKWCASEVSLPVHAYLTDSEIDQVVGSANTFRM
jgi:dTDP-3-amino-3,4,6-trideoxy-alpha-D-glucose transaminase